MAVTHFVVPKEFLTGLSDFLDKTQDLLVSGPAVLTTLCEQANVLQFKVDHGIIHTQENTPREVYLVIEDEPETSTGYPSVVVGVHWTKAAANAQVADKRRERGLEDDDAYEESDITWNVESHTVGHPEKDDAPATPAPPVSSPPPVPPVEEAEEGIDPFAVLETIQQRLDGVEWSPETLDQIADDLRAAGYAIRGTGEES